MFELTTPTSPSGQEKAMHIAPYLSLAAVVLLAAALPGMAQSQFSITAEPRVLHAPLQTDAPQVTALALRAQNRGLVRVIARVARPAGIGAGAVSDADLAAVQERFRSRTLTLGAAQVEPIIGLPLSVIEVDAAQLQEMVRAGLISDVVEDVPDPPALQDSIPLIHADIAATLGATGAGQTIAILDTGVDAGHPFFGGRVVSEACYSSNSQAAGATTVCPGLGGGVITSSTARGSAAPCGNAGCNHGTHVAGIAAGQDRNRRGVAPQANIIAIQVFSLFTDVPGPGGPQSCANAGQPSPCILTFTSDQIRGLQRVFDLRTTFTIASVNMSLGGGTPVATCDTDSRKALIDQLRGARIATVVAAGNNSSSTGVSAPGCITTAITVGNTTKTDTVNGTSNSAAVVDLLAPGTNITSSVPGGGFASMSGTSMATPHVAGAFAALRSVRNDLDLTVDQIEARLKSTGVSITDPRNNLARPRLAFPVDLTSADYLLLLVR
jgi:subtilisin family serine protease